MNTGKIALSGRKMIYGAALLLFFMGNVSPAMAKMAERFEKLSGSPAEESLQASVPDVASYNDMLFPGEENRGFTLNLSGQSNPTYDLDGDGLNNQLELWIASTFSPVYIYDKEEHNIVLDVKGIKEFRDVAYFYQVTPGHCDPASAYTRSDYGMSPSPTDDVILTIVAAYVYDYVPRDPIYWSEDDVFAHYGDTELVRICLEKHEGYDVPEPKQLKQLHGAEYFPSVSGSVRRSAYSVALIAIKRHHDDPKPYRAVQFVWENDTHVRLYISEGKHAAYLSDGECEDYVGGKQWIFWDEDCSSMSDNPQVIRPQSLRTDLFNVGEQNQNGQYNQLLNTTQDIRDSSKTTFINAEAVWDPDRRFCGGYYPLIDDPSKERNIITLFGKGYKDTICGGGLGSKWFSTSASPQIQEAAPGQNNGSSVSGEVKWAVVMSKGTGYGQQTWVAEASFPKTFISGKWDAGYHITGLTYGSGQWAVVMTKGTGYSGQTWATRSSFPQDFISEKWDAGYRITSLAYGDGKWAVVMSKGTGYGQQTWASETSFPKTFISEKWDADYHITSLAYGGGKWAVVMTKETGYSGQSWATRTSFPQDFISEKWDAGYHVTSLAYGGGKWAAVMTKGTGYDGQSWATRASFPQDFISEKWDAGYDVTVIHNQ